MSNIKTRLIALENNVPSEWLVLECDSEPTAEQFHQMEDAHKEGQFAILIVAKGDTVWLVGFPKPWEQA